MGNRVRKKPNRRLHQQRIVCSVSNIRLTSSRTMSANDSTNTTKMTTPPASSINFLLSTPVVIGILIGICLIIYKIFRDRIKAYQANVPAPLPKMRKQDMNLSELRKYDGNQSDGRILVAVNGKVFDVTRGRKMYGPGAPYSSFAGHDASRALAMFQTDLIKEEDDDLSDLNSKQMESIQEWDAQLSENYDLVGRLLKPGEEPSNYSDDEDGDQNEDERDHSKDD